MKIFGMEVVEAPEVPPGEAWIVQGPKQFTVWRDGDRIAHVEERPPKVLCKIVNVEVPE